MRLLSQKTEGAVCCHKTWKSVCVGHLGSTVGLKASEPRMLLEGESPSVGETSAFPKGPSLLTETE